MICEPEIPAEATPGEAAAVALTAAGKAYPEVIRAKYRGHWLIVHAHDHVLRLERTITRRLRTGPPRNQIICVPTRYSGFDPDEAERFDRGEEVRDDYCEELYEGERA